jgi:hypothetical protein
MHLGAMNEESASVECATRRVDDSDKCEEVRESSRLHRLFSKDGQMHTPFPRSGTIPCGGLRVCQCMLVDPILHVYQMFQCSTHSRCWGKYASFILLWLAVAALLQGAAGLTCYTTSYTVRIMPTLLSPCITCSFLIFTNAGQELATLLSVPAFNLGESSETSFPLPLVAIELHKLTRPCICSCGRIDV